MKKVIQLVVAIFVCQSAGFIGSLFTAPNIPSWYQGLTKPFFSPPNWLFAPVWFLLYTLMGIAAFLIWQRHDERRARRLLLVFFIHLIVNTLWSVLFFGLQNPLLGLIDIVVMLALIFYLIFGFYRLNKIAAWLLFPYLIWVSFATLLNYFIYVYN